MKKIVSGLFCLAAGAAGAFDSTSYVAQDALIAQWDGIDNVIVGGLRQHDDNATVWMDLTGGGADFNLSPFIGSQLTGWSDKSLVAKSCWQVPSARSCKDYVTIEICIKSPGNAVQMAFNSGDGLVKECAVYANHRIQFRAGGKCYFHPTDDLVQAAAIYAADAIDGVTSSAADPAVVTNGYPTTYNGTDSWGGNQSITCLGRGANNYQFTGEYYAIRLYNRALTQEELIRNAQIDNARFFGRVPTGSLSVGGDPLAVGAPLPAYGLHDGFSAGELVGCTCPPVWTNAEQTIAATCLGFSVMTNGVEWLKGDETQARFEFPSAETFVDLSWKWRMEYAVSVEGSVPDGCSVSPTRVWGTAGTRVTLTATCDATHAVCLWRGVEGTQDGNTFTFTMPATPVTVTPVFAASYFVATNGSDEAVGTDRDHPVATIGAALAKAQEAGTAAVVSVGPGRYEMAAGQGVSVSGGLPARIFSEQGAAETVLVRTVNGVNMLTLDQPESSFHGFTFMQPNRSLGWGVVMSLLQGTVEHCVISNLGFTQGIKLAEGAILRDSDICDNSQSGNDGAVALFGGTLERCRLVRNLTNHGTYGEVVEFWTAGPTSGGVVRNCLIAANTNQSDHTGAVAFQRANGLLENCTIVNNRTLGTSKAAGVDTVNGNGTVRNCIVFGNCNAAGPAEFTERYFDHCASSVAMSGAGNLKVSSIDFADPASGDYRVMSGPTIDAGVSQPWMAGATDLGGEDRVIGSAPDIGCYEYRPGGLRASVSASSTQALGTGNFTLTATVSGADLEGLVCSWQVTQGGVTVATGAERTLELANLGIGSYDVAFSVRNGAGEEFVYEDGANLLNVYPRTVYIAKNSTPTPPYATWETAADDLTVALQSQLDGMTYLIGPGVYTNTDCAIVGKAVTVKGVEGRDRTVLVRVAKGHALLRVANAEARVEGLTLTQDARTEAQGGKVLGMTSGTFADSQVVNCYSRDDDLIGVTGATVTNCIFRNNYALGRIAHYWAGADSLTVGCTFFGNETDNNTYCAAIYSSSGTATIRNCLLACNTNNSYNAAGITSRGGVFENCTVVSNYTKHASYAGAVGIDHESAYPTTIRNCIFRFNCNPNGETNIGSKVSNGNLAHAVSYTLTEPLYPTGEGNVSGDPRFASRHTYRLLPSSPAVDAGLNADWMSGAVDILGNPRITWEDRGGTVDMGCCECIPRGLMMLVK